MAGQPLGSPSEPARVYAEAMRIREIIASLPEAKRHVFQELYSNNYDAFHKRLAKPDVQHIFDQFASQKNPQVSTSEYCLHGARYAAGVKYLGAGVEQLDPEYDGNGKPRHPYLGKLYVILVDETRLGELVPFFVVWAHANNLIKVSDHFRKNVLVEREVSFPGFIPGECVVLSVPVRVPSFTGDYKPWYQAKYGLSKRSYNCVKKEITIGKYFKEEKRSPEVVRATAVQGLLEKHILPHLDEILMQHVKSECESHHITLLYKNLGQGFDTALASLANASSQREMLAKRNQETPAATPQ